MEPDITLIDSDFEFDAEQNRYGNTAFKAFR